jgi:hypothetical protein
MALMPTTFNQAGALDVDLMKSAMAALTETHYQLQDANRALHGLSWKDRAYVAAVPVIDHAILLCNKAKWFFGRATGELADFATRTDSNEDLSTALALFAEARSFADAALAFLKGDTTALPAVDTAVRLSRPGTEIYYFDDIPVVPNICPIVLLEGSSFEMGRQYAEQTIAIFGPFIYQSYAARSYDRTQQAILAQWRAELAAWAPELIEMSQGIAAGCRAAGIAISDEAAIALWTGDLPPAEDGLPIGVLDAASGDIAGYFGTSRGGAGEEAAAKELCSGVAAWGRATRNGEMVAGATTDHDCTFQVSIIAYPDSGNPFIYTPFSVNAGLPFTGRFYFAGHPGINSKGVTHVHHGGVGGCAEPRDEWGYGIKRGASVFHILRFANSAQEARAMEMAMPIGDAGSIMGSPGAFYADPDYGYILESRGSAAKAIPPIMREGSTGADGVERDYLYSNNNLLSPASATAFMAPDSGYAYDRAGGWYLKDSDLIATANAAQKTRWMMSRSSQNRNHYFDRIMAPAAKDAAIDIAFMEHSYRQGPQFDPATPWPVIEQSYVETLLLDKGSASHRLNAFTALCLAKKDEAPEYWSCIGPMSPRSVTPSRAGHGFFYYDETSMPWHIVLAADADRLVATLHDETKALVREAQTLVAKHGDSFAGIATVTSWLEAATAGLAATGKRDAVARAYASAQVRAKQVIAALTA